MSNSDAGYTLRLQAPIRAFTARNLQDFAECPRKFMLSHFATRRGGHEFLGGPGMLGRAVRGALLCMYAVADPAAFGLEALLEAFEEGWEPALCADSLEQETLHKDGIRMLERHHESPLDLPGPLDTDVRFEQTIGEYSFVAVADIVSKSPATVVRITTSRRPVSAGELTGDISWGLLALVATQAMGGEVTCVMADMRKNRRVCFTLEDQQRERIQQRVTALAKRIRGEQQFAPIKGKQCRWCRSRRECPAWR